METAMQVKSKPQEKLEVVKLVPEKRKPGAHVKTEVETEVETEVKLEIKSETKNEATTPPAAKRRRPPAKRRNLAEERIKKEKEASGASKVKEASGASMVKGEKRAEAIAAFRAKYGELNGATVCHMPGWRAESLWCEACQQLAVNYFNEPGNCFTTVKDIEALLGLRVLQGLECDEVNVGRARVMKDESGKVVSVARQKTDMTRSLDGMDIIANTTGDGLPLLAKNRKRGHDSLVSLLNLGAYVEHASLALLPMPGGGNRSAIAESWAKAGKTAEDLAALLASAAKIHPLLVARGFDAEVKLFGFHGCEPDTRFADALEGIFYEMPGGTHNGRPCFQKVRVSAEGVLSCAGPFIFWELSHQEWRVSVLRDKLVPLAIGVSKGDTPAEPGNRWRLLELEEEIKKDSVPSAARGRSTLDNTSLMPKIKRRIIGKTAPPESAGGTARASTEPSPPNQFISVIDGTATSHDPTGTKLRIHIAARSAGVRNISWNNQNRAWLVSQQVPGKGQKHTKFRTTKWVDQGLAFEEAVARALEEAKAFVAELRARGAIRAGPAARSSGVRGVTWCRARSLWQAILTARDAAGRKFCVEKLARFRPADDSEAAIEEARIKAVRCRQDMEARHLVFVRDGKPIPQRK